MIERGYVSLVPDGDEWTGVSWGERVGAGPLVVVDVPAEGLALDLAFGEDDGQVDYRSAPTSTRIATTSSTISSTSTAP